MAQLYIGLVHYPIYNKNGDIITTAITNFDIHDIARSARTYDVKKYFVIHQVENQIALVREIMDHWQTGLGSRYNPDRKEAFRIIAFQPSIEAAVREIQETEKQPPYIVTTDARIYPNTISYTYLRRKLAEEERPCLLLFGTGWGIQREVMEGFDYILEPIYGPCDYNHLPVRAAAAIMLDRLCGEAWWTASDHTKTVIGNEK